MPDVAERRKSLSDVIKVHKSVRVVHGLPRLVLTDKAQQHKRNASGASNRGKEEPNVDEETRRQNFSDALEQEYRQRCDAAIAEMRQSLEEEYSLRVVEEREKVRSFIKNIESQIGELENRFEGVAINLALALAEKIIRREVASEPEAVLRQIREAVRRVLGVERIKLRVNPGDEEIVRDRRAAVIAQSDSIREVVIEADEGVERGGCILESDSGNVDAQLSTQLKNIEAVLFADDVART